MMISVLALFAGAWLPTPSPAFAPERLMCSLVLPPGERVEDPLSRTQKLVAQAQAIVWVTGARAAQPKDMQKASVTWEPADAAPPNAVAFDVREVLKGDSVPRLIIVTGTVSDTNDFDDQSVPYIGVRPEGRKGSCFAYVYKRNGQFLLLLARGQPGRVTPYWAPLQPVNEQITGKSDPWLVWVRNEISASQPH